MSPSRGASLLEACLVVAIISSLMMIAVPSFVEARQQWLLQSAAYQIRSELHYARIQSIMRMQDCRLRVTSPVTYLVECQTHAWLPLRYGTMPRRLRVTANNRPEFHPRGNVAPMASIFVWNDRGARKRIVVNRSGRVRIE